MGTAVITGLKTKEAFALLLRSATNDSSLGRMERLLPGILTDLVLNSLTVALVQFPPARFVEAVDKTRSLRQDLETAQKRIARPDYVAASPSFPLRKLITFMLIWHVLYLFFAADATWYDPITSMAAGIGMLLTGLAGTVGGPATIAPLILRNSRINVNSIPAWALVLGYSGAAVSEEVLRSYSPWMMMGLAVHEVYAYMRLGVPFIHRMPAFLLHCGLHVHAPGSFRARAAVHVAFNIMAVFSTTITTVSSNGDAYTESTHERIEEDARSMYAWASYWARGQIQQVVPRVIRLRDLGINRLRTFMPHFEIPEHVTHYFSTLKVKVGSYTYRGSRAAEEIKKWCVDECVCDHLGQCSDCHAAREVEFTYPTMMTNGFLYAPRNGNASLGVALIRRTLADPTGGLLSDPETEMAFYMVISVAIEDAFTWFDELGISLDKDYSIAECAHAMGSTKGRNLTETYERMLDGQYIQRTTMQEKWNEQVKSTENGNFTPGIKPRLICAVATDDQVHTLGLARALMTELKRVFDGDRIFSVGDYRVRICIAQTDADSLSSYGAAMQGTVPFLVVLGDDAALSSGSETTGPFTAPFMEGDYGQYDHTQFMPLWHRLRRTCAALGIPSWWIEKLIDCIIRGLKGGKAYPVRAKISAKAHPQMHSGLSVTSVVGSLFNIMNWVNAMLKKITISESSRSFGFKIKEVSRTTLEQVTFLRGWWQPNHTGAHTWVALPSACLKLGKLFRDPCTLVKGDYSNATKTAMVFRAVMESVAGLPDDYPILGAMRCMSRSLAGHCERVTQIMNDPYIAENMRWKVYGRGECSRKAVLDAMFERYDISESEVLEAESLILSVTELPSFVGHPLFDKMRVVDYA
jgi:hypothetical protein